MQAICENTVLITKHLRISDIIQENILEKYLNTTAKCPRKATQLICYVEINHTQ